MRPQAFYWFNLNTSCISWRNIIQFFPVTFGSNMLWFYDNNDSVYLNSRHSVPANDKNVANTCGILNAKINSEKTVKI